MAGGSMQKAKKAMAIAEVWFNAAKAIITTIKDFDYDNYDTDVLGIQLETIKRCARAQAELIARTPDTSKFKNGGIVVGGCNTDEVVLNINRDHVLTPKQQEDIMRVIRDK
jgi:hypothetical protein